ncbi:MAG TPA: GAF domain-containing protein [Egibacteraceae bacterium]|nr:GAF domain-containing protein [Egibacteraceae bacterium]
MAGNGSQQADADLSLAAATPQDVLRRRATRAEALARLSARVAEAGEDIDAVLTAVVETAVPVLAPMAMVNLLTSDGAWVEMVAHHHEDPEVKAIQERVMAGMRRPVEGPIAELLATQRPVRTVHVPESFMHLVPVEMRQTVLDLAPSSFALLPMRTHGRVIGHLTLGRAGGEFDDDDLAFGVELADRAALLIDNARMVARLRSELADRTRAEQQARRRADQQAAAAALSTHALAGASLHDVANRAARAVAEHLGVQACKVVERLPSGELLVLATWGLRMKPLSRLPDDSLSSATLLRGDLVVIDDFASSAGVPLSPHLAAEGIRSAMSVPLQLGDERLGAMAALSQTPRSFHCEDAAFLATMGNIVAGDIQLHRLRGAERRASEAERLAAVGRMAVGMAHDFNNIMLAVRLYTELLEDEPGLDETGRRHLRSIADQVEHASKMVADVLDFGRTPALTIEAVDMAATVQHVVEMHRATVPDAISMTWSSHNAQAALADPLRVRQVLANVVNNARDAMPDGGRLHIDVHHETDAPTGPSGAPLSSPAGWVVVVVSDTGTGMDAETLRRARDPFFTTKPPGAGTGLGLAQVDMLVTQQGGWMDIESEPGAGTTVRLRLPAHAPGVGALETAGDLRGT